MKLILFDFDGVLVDTLGIAYSINIGADQSFSLEEYKTFFEGNIYEAINKGKKKHIPDFDDQYYSKTREIKIPEILKEIIKKLSVNHTLAIVSSTPTNTISEILTREGIRACFDNISGSDVHKSKVVKIKALLDKYNINGKEAVFVTDTVGDIMEGRECGVPSVAVTWGFHEEATLLKAKPEKIVSVPEDLTPAIEEILNA